MAQCARRAPLALTIPTRAMAISVSYVSRVFTRLSKHGPSIVIIAIRASTTHKLDLLHLKIVFRVHLENIP